MQKEEHKDQESINQITCLTQDTIWESDKSHTRETTGHPFPSLQGREKSV